MTTTVTCAHDWVREETRRGPTNVTLSCRLCGAASVSQGKVRARTVTTSLNLYPPRGATFLDPGLYEFFIRQWDAETHGLTQTGFLVHRRPPIIHAQARTGTSRPRDRGRGDRFITGRDLMLAVAIVLLGGVTMLVAGIMLHIGWLAVAGGVALGVLFLLLLLVIHLSN